MSNNPDGTEGDYLFMEQRQSGSEYETEFAMMRLKM